MTAGSAPAAGAEILHASCVCLGPLRAPPAARRALLILGGSGAGKSALALELISRGAVLVADDQVALRREGAALIAAPPRTLAGLVEARGLGLLRVPWAAAAVSMAVDLDAPAQGRLPPARTRLLLGAAVPLMVAPERTGAAALLVALRFGPPLDPDAPLAAGRPGD